MKRKPNMITLLNVRKFLIERKFKQQSEIESKMS